VSSGHGAHGTHGTTHGSSDVHGKPSMMDKLSKSTYPTI
jgi:hypothetical protein